jgi:hypothetical protein
VAVFVGRFSCTTEQSARRLANAMLVAGLDPELSAPRLPGEPWSVIAPADLKPTPANLVELQQTMSDAATRAGAMFLTLQPGEE